MAEEGETRACLVRGKNGEAGHLLIKLIVRAGLMGRVK